MTTVTEDQEVLTNLGVGDEPSLATRATAAVLFLPRRAKRAVLWGKGQLTSQRAKRAALWSSGVLLGVVYLLGSMYIGYMFIQFLFSVSPTVATVLISLIGFQLLISVLMLGISFRSYRTEDEVTAPVPA